MDKNPSWKRQIISLLTDGTKFNCYSEKALSLKCDFENSKNRWFEKDKYGKSVLWYLGADDHYCLNQVECLINFVDNDFFAKMEILKGFASEGTSNSGWGVLESVFAKNNVEYLGYDEEQCSVIFFDIFNSLVKRNICTDAFLLKILKSAESNSYWGPGFFSCLENASGSILKQLVKKMEPTSLKSIESYIGVYLSSKDWLGALKEAVLWDNHIVYELFKKTTVLNVKEAQGIESEKDFVLEQLFCYCSFLNKTNWVKMLSGVIKNVNTVDDDFKTPIYYAVQHGNSNLVSMLLGIGSNPLQRTGSKRQGLSAHRLALNAKNKSRQKCLSLIEEFLLNESLMLPESFVQKPEKKKKPFSASL